MDRRGVPYSLGAAWDARDNGITAMRLGLAAFVAFSHAFQLGAFGPDPYFVLTSGQAHGGTLAVSAFFVLSGFLLVQSRATSSPGRFLWHRSLRILPAFWVCLVVVGLALAPAELWSYVGANALLVIRQHTLGGAFAANPVPSEVNGSLWTLAPEFACYLVLCAMPKRALRLLVPGTLVFLAVLHIGMSAPMLFHDLILSFAVGATLGIARAWIPMHGAIAASLVLGIVAATSVGRYTTVAPFVVGYLTLFAAVRLPLRWRRDYSYGTYIYAFPVQQALTALGCASLGLVVYLGMMAVVVGILAALSWHLVEHPILVRGRSLRARTVADRRHVATVASAPTIASG